MEFEFDHVFGVIVDGRGWEFASCGYTAIGGGGWTCIDTERLSEETDTYVRPGSVSPECVPASDWEEGLL